VRAAYPAEVYARLRDVKTKFDPGNLFHGAQNIPPR
jgi:FAD/FMN-containing dehydrogenase